MSESDIGSGQDDVLPPPDTGNICSDNNAESDSSSASSTNENSDIDVVATFSSLYLKMYHIFKELIIMFLLFAMYTAITHDPPKVSKAPPAYPFFPKGSLVRDWYRGEISKAINTITDSDICFMMFYAPWDAESQEIRAEVELAAQHMHKIVAFNAINCWQPRSECRVKYGKVYSWPVLIAYTTHGRVIQYNGPKTAPHIMKFLNNVMNPFVRINSSVDIYSLLALHDAVVVAGVDVRPGSLDFAIFYTIALKYLEKDPFGDVAFALLSKSADEESFLSLHMWNETLFYPHDEEFSTENAVNWLSKNIHQVAMWVSPSGSKSQLLSSYLQNPSLILFTPFNPLATSTDFYHLLKEIALDYHNCNADLKLAGEKLNIYWHRRYNQLKHRHLSVTCSKNVPKSQPSKFTRTVTYSPSMWQNNSACFFDSKNSKCFSDEAEMTNHWIRKYDTIKNYYEHEIKQPLIDQGIYCQEKSELNRYPTSMIFDPNDLRSPEQLKKGHKERACKFHELAEDFLPALISLDGISTLNITGHACKGNRTLSFIAMDSLTYHHFAERFGVNILKQKNKTALILINDKEEVHHTYDGYITESILKQFIINFTESNLPRALHSNSVKFRYTHVYNAKKDCNSDNTVCIPELDSRTFLPTIMEENKAVIVFYHSKQCSFCNGISYKFLMAAKVLSFVKSIKFARIDGDLNTLPWEYTMETYPSILLFPAKRKSESRAFPQDLPITVSNLISFILMNMEPTMKLNIMWSICNHTTHVEDKTTCVSSLRAENLAVIELTLKEWRLANPRAKQQILRKLQQLRSLHLELAQVPPNEKSIGAHFELLNKSSLKTVLYKVVKDQMRQWHDDF